MLRKGLMTASIAAIALLLVSCNDNSTGSPTSAPTPTPTPTPVSAQDALNTTTPIKHLVVIFGENVSFDHYFGTYPQSSNPSGEPVPDSANAPSNVPSINGYLKNASLLTANPNMTNAANLAKVSDKSQLNPFRIDRAQFDTADQSHAYTAEQKATDNLKMDAFVANTGKGGTGLSPLPSPSSAYNTGAFSTVAQVLGYFDGNTVTALWNYAQNFAMNDSAFTDSFGPSTPGAMNVVAGNTGNAKPSTGSGGGTTADGQGGFSQTGDADPTNDICSSATSTTVTMGGTNIGDLLNAAGITWGGFMGGFDLTATNPNGSATTVSNGVTTCGRTTTSPTTQRPIPDYVPHHAFFQYWASTENPKHTRPSSVAMIGQTEPTLDSSATPVHHQYDYNDFVAAVTAGNYPSVSYIKAPAYGDGHPGNSNALDEQTFVTKTLNFLQQQPDWKNTAVIITYDDSDGWYDHQAPNILTSSFDASADQMNAPGQCTGPNAKQGTNLAGQSVNGRCGPGTRIPFLLISPYAKANYVDSTPITQASVVRFIEDNWLGGKRLGGGSNDSIAGSIMAMFDFTATPRTTPLFLDPTTGKKTATAPAA